MLVFRFWLDLDLPTEWRATYALVEPREIDDEHAMFDQIMAAVKKTDCKWTLTEMLSTQVKISPRLSQNDIHNHRKRT